MTSQDAKLAVGRTVHHADKYGGGHGNAILLRASRLGCRICVWGGPSGDKKYEFTVPASELTLGHKQGK